MNDTTRRGFIFGAATLVASGLLLGVQRVLSSAFADSDREVDAGPVKVAQFSVDGAPIGVTSLPKVRKSLGEWKKQLTPLEFEVTREEGTEWAFSGALDKQYGLGLYRCIDCDNALFDSRDEIRFGHRLAKFLGADCAGKCLREKICEFWHRAARGEVHAVRRASGARFYRWAQANGTALLHELRGAAVRATSCGLIRRG